MVKIISFIRRNPDFTHAQFVDYWKNVHAPMCRDLLPGLRHYVGKFPTGDGHGGREPDYDGLIELGFDDVESLRAALSSPSFQTAERKASSAKVMDDDRTEHLIVEDCVIEL